MADKDSAGGADLAGALARVVGALRRVTVQVRTRGRRGDGAGSGIVWRPDGLVVTNAHVVRGERAVVELPDGERLDGRVVRMDRSRDLAALEVPARGLPTPLVGDPRTLRAGDLVIAVGSPFGVPGAASVGVVHQVEPAGAGRGPRWIRADVRLAPGNSGGPLADAAGRVMGVNAMIANGLGLAVPTTAVARFLAEGAPAADRATLGVAVRPVLAAAAGARSLGLMLAAVAEGGAAARAGLLLGDVLLAADGVPFTHPGDLAVCLEEGGDRLRLHLLRGGRRLDVDVALRPAPARAA